MRFSLAKPERFFPECPRASTRRTEINSRRSAHFTLHPLFVALIIHHRLYRPSHRPRQFIPPLNQPFQLGRAHGHLRSLLALPSARSRTRSPARPCTRFRRFLSLQTPHGPPQPFRIRTFSADFRNSEPVSKTGRADSALEGSNPSLSAFFDRRNSPSHGGFCSDDRTAAAIICPV
jgi:hypothetical protein